jgi:pimeloyl-ACP methyl ester carboxylesterase
MPKEAADVRLQHAVICALACAALATGCGYLYIGARDDMSEKRREPGGGTVYSTAVLIGEAAGAGRGPVLVLARPVSGPATTPADYVILDRPGRFMLYVPAGPYRVLTFTDANGDGTFTGNEITGSAGGPSGITVGEGEVVAGIAPAGSATGGAPAGSISIRDDGRVPHQSVNGERIRLYEERFCHQNAEAGMWRPTLFMKAFGANICVADEYAPGKVPVLFVHGAQGSPRDWAYFHYRLADPRFARWYYYYPTGIRLALAARLLYEALLDMKKKCGYARICITAHSMGGLIVRHLLANYDLAGHGIDARLYVSLASPWSGYESADRAMQLPAKKLPIWLDVGTTSDFIRRTLEAHIPAGTSYHLFYGTSDGVSAGRALDDRACRDAKGKHGFEVTHDTILSDRRVFGKYYEVLTTEMR